MTALTHDELLQFVNDVKSFCKIYEDSIPNKSNAFSYRNINFPKDIKNKDDFSEAQLKSLFVYKHLSIGASEYYISLDDVSDSNGLEPQEFNQILERFYPDIKLRDYLDLRSLSLKFYDDDEHGYYGEHTSHLFVKVNLVDIASFLKEKNKLTLLPLENEIKEVKADKPKKKSTKQLKK